MRKRPFGSRIISLEPEVKSAPISQRQQPVSTPVEGTVFRTTGNLAYTPESQSAPLTNTRVWEVGVYKDIRGVEKGLDAHHVGQKAIMNILIPGYNLNTAPAILVPAEGHTFLGPVGMVSRNTKGFTNPRQVVARDVFELRRVYGTQGIPNSALMNLIQMNKDTYPIPFIKPKR